jgi:hypothetical protein
MKKIITTILLSTLSLAALSQGIFNMAIPQPDYVSNDWDGDGEINSVDLDDDDDGILDVNDSTPFGGSPGGSITPPYVYNGDTCADDGLLTQLSADELNSWSGLTHSPAAWCGLTVLVLTSNNFNFVPDIIGGLSNLDELHIGNQTGLTALPNSIGALTDLTRLHVNNNNLVAIPKTIKNLVNLTHLYVSYNQLIEIPDILGDLSQLKFFFANNNQIATMSDTISELVALTHLDLTVNQLNTIPDSINSLSNVSYLQLHTNPGSVFSNISCSGISTCSN